MSCKEKNQTPHARALFAIRAASPDVPPALSSAVTHLPSLKNIRLTDFSSWEARFLSSETPNRQDRETLPSDRARSQLTRSVLLTHAQEVLNNLLATACMVPLAGLPMWSDKYGLILDGGLSDLQILRGWVDGSFNAVHDSAPDAITACPFYFSRADIKPDKYVPFWWAFLPPAPETVRDIYRMGQRNATDWIIRTQGGTLPRTVVAPPGGGRAMWRSVDMGTARQTAEEYAAAARAAVRSAAEAASGAAHKMEGLASDAAHAVEGLATDAAHAAGEIRSAVSGAAHAAEEFALHAAAVASDAARRAAQRLRGTETLPALI